MMQQFVLGTLTALNSVMSPLVAPGNGKPIYPLDLKTAVASELCPTARKGFLGLQVDEGLGRDLTLKVSGQICRTQTASRNVALVMNLPADLLDQDFVERLPVGTAYVTTGIPNEAKNEIRERLKIVRQKEEEGLIPLKIEWIRTDDSQRESPPLTLWFRPHSPSSLPWEKIELGQLAALVPGPLEIGPGPITVHAPRRRY